MLNLKTIRKKNPKEAQRLKRRMTVRKKISGSEQRPRISVFRSAKHIYVQAINDDTGATVAAASSVDKSLKTALDELNKVDQAAKVGEALGHRLVEKGIKAAVFDRNGFRFHGRVKAVADGARSGGLDF